MSDQSNPTPQGTQELTVFVQNLLQQMVRWCLLNILVITICSKEDSKKWVTPLLKEVHYCTIANKYLVDDMGTRIDDLEKSIGELMSQVCAQKNNNI